MSIDLERAQRELLRWNILNIAQIARPEPVAESLILSAVQEIPIVCTARDLRREMDYLEKRMLVELARHEGAPWTVELTRAGIDVCDYRVDVEPGIARPKKYWVG